MKKLIVLSLLAILLTNCKKDNDPTPDPEPEPEEMVFQGTGTLPDGTPMDCELFDEMYFSHRLDFGSISFQHVGSVTFNDNGTCTNHWSGDDSFVSWEYWELSGDKICNVIKVKIKDDNGDIIDTMISFTQYFDDRMQGVRLDNGDVYYFYPL